MRGRLIGKWCWGPLRRNFSAPKDAKAAEKGMDTPTLVFERSSANMATILLNRPKALNALNIDMCAGMKSHLLDWRGNLQPPHLFVLKGAGGKAFCAGGDVKTVWQELHDRGASIPIGTGERGLVHTDFFRQEYEMNYLLGTSKVVQVSLWDGIVMGGGVGISVLGAFRVATEKTMFAMPETAIGLFPDVGSSSWLPHLKPTGFGLYMGLSGARLRAADLLATGIATHFISSEKLPELESALASLETTSDSAHMRVKTLLQSFHEQSIPNMDTSQGILPRYASNITATFGSTACSPEDILRTLEANAPTCTWSRETLQLISKMSPTSLQLTCRQLQEGQGKNLGECLEMEFRLVMRCMAAPDFKEGIRALLVDKDHNPKWQPATSRDDKMQGYFAPLVPHNELNLLALV